MTEGFSKFSKPWAMLHLHCHLGKGAPEAPPRPAKASGRQWGGGDLQPRPGGPVRGASQAAFFWAAPQPQVTLWPLAAMLWYLAIFSLSFQRPSTPALAAPHDSQARLLVDEHTSTLIPELRGMLA